MSEALLLLTARLAVPVLAVGLLLCVCWLSFRWLATLHNGGQGLGFQWVSTWGQHAWRMVSARSRGACFSAGLVAVDIPQKGVGCGAPRSGLLTWRSAAATRAYAASWSRGG